MPKKKLQVKATHHDFAPSDESLGGKKKKKAKLKYSNYYMTINSNLAKGIDKKKFRDGFVDVFDNIGDYIKFKGMKEPNYDLIDSIKVSTHPEVGKKRGLIHGHALVKIKHRTKIGLDYDGMREALIESGAVPASGFHFYSKLVKDNVGTLKDYMTKTMRHEEISEE